ncbi:MAG: Gfo/Idh/MocA family oxidoreductase [Candidatus Heimdallarchaeota archaeon]|nr:Gfo/Idh/MocA family oxidoreductase [Candidatus Heimdallarchaeota archaeon]
MTFKVGIIGAGIIGGAFTWGFNEFEETEVVAICDLDPWKTNALANEFHIEHTYTDHKEMLKRDDIDIIYIGVPPKHHKSIFLDSIKSGKHVLVEKPIALNYQEGKQMMDAAKNSSCITAIDLIFRYNLAVKKLKELISSDHIGTIRRLQLTFRFPIWPRDWQQVNWLKERIQGGPLREVGSHFFFLLTELFGSVKRLSSLVEYSGPDCYENGVVGTIEMESGLVCTLDLLADVPELQENTLTIHGEKETISFTDWSKLNRLTKDGVWEFFYEDKGNATQEIIREFIQAIRGEDHDLVALKTGVYTQQILDAIISSNGEWVYFNK